MERLVGLLKIKDLKLHVDPISHQMMIYIAKKLQIITFTVNE